MNKTLEVAYMATKDAISITLNGRFRSLKLDTDQGQKLLAAVKKRPQDIDEIAALADVATYITRHTFGRVTLDDKDQIRLDGSVVDFGLTNVICRMINDGSDINHLVKFIENVALNPDPEIAPHLYSFLEKGEMPITPDGQFHAFKRVDDDYRSFHSGEEDVGIFDSATGENYRKERGHITHKIGTTLVMDRELCDAARNKTCSVGLHACSPFYLDSWYGGRGRLLIVKIHPRDVTAIPNDYNDSKLRCCLLQVVDEIPGDEAKKYFTKSVEMRYSPASEAAAAPVVDAASSSGEAKLNDDIIDLVFRVEVSPEMQSTIDDIKAEIQDIIDQQEADAEIDKLLRPCDTDDEFFEAIEILLGGEAGDEMSVIDAIELGIEDGENEANEDGEFVCDPQDGDAWSDISDDLELIYMIAYMISYAHAFELDHYYSETAFRQGVADGKMNAGPDVASQTFAPMFTEGEHWDFCAEAHADEYAKGYVCGYALEFTSSVDSSEIIPSFGFLQLLAGIVGI